MYCFMLICFPLHSTSWRVLVCLGRSPDQILSGRFCLVSVHSKAWGLCANDRNQHLGSAAFWPAAPNAVGVDAQEKWGSRFLMDVKAGLWGTALTKDPRARVWCHSVQCLAVLHRSSPLWCGALSNSSFVSFSFGTRLLHHYPGLLKTLYCSE